MFLLGVGLVTLLGQLYLNKCNPVRYVVFNTSLNLLNMKNKRSLSRQSVFAYFSVIMLGLFLGECEEEQILLIIISANINFRCVAYFVLKLEKLFRLPSLLPIILIILSNDIHVNLGPHFHNIYF